VGFIYILQSNKTAEIVWLVILLLDWSFYY
jgi:hypothetical protein